jgi:HAD superfamily hydrolase (TIGR01509 family)
MQAIVFDFFGVICSEITPFVLPKYMSKEAAVEYKATVVHESDLGHIELDDVLAHLSKVTGANPEALLADFWSFVKIDGEVVKLIDELKGRYRTALLSNAIRPFLRQILARHDLERRFDAILISAEEGIAKPDPAFFQRMIDRLGVPAQECFFIDDNMPNVEAARAAGMRAMLFEGAESVRRELAASDRASTP